MNRFIRREINRIRDMLKSHRFNMFFLKLKPYLLRYIVILVAISGLIWYAVYTNYIITRLKDQAYLATSTYAGLISSAMTKNMGVSNEKKVLLEILNNFDIPVIVVNKNNKPIVWNNISVGKGLHRREISPYDTSEVAFKHISNKAQELRKIYSPRPISWRNDTLPIGYLIFGDTPFFNKLRFMPFLDALFVLIFSVIFYLIVYNTMESERSNIWVGLAKETAHQLGTPISSLMGWVEYIRCVRSDDSDIDTDTFISQMETICDDMDNDLNRLRKITNRFSQIGSKPKMKKNDINSLVFETVDYFKNRIPVLGRKIDIVFFDGECPEVSFNYDLLGWVLENMFKNSIDAIVDKNGLISIKTEYDRANAVVRIIHKDNGKGISWDKHNSVFSPGYTTKKRGWGLGLALAKRIVEDYHRGRIYIIASQKGVGTEFAIELPVT